MLSCVKVLNLLSEFIDEALDPKADVDVSQHLSHCGICRKEYESLLDLKQKVRSLSTMEEARSPEYLRSLIQVQLAARRQESWGIRVRNALERRWSIIRTTEGIWYLTRVLGTVMTTIFFFLISTAITPYYYYINVNAKAADPAPLSAAYSQQVGINFLKKLGKFPLQLTCRSEPAINDLYLLKFGESVSLTDQNDSLSIVTAIDRSGSAKIQDVLEYPSDRKLLSSFNEMAANARYRPASRNGQSVSSHMVLMFSSISVSD